MKSEEIKNWVLLELYQFRFQIKSILDAENIESYGNIFGFMILLKT
jgi:hypothetical protein